MSLQGDVEPIHLAEVIRNTCLWAQFNIDLGSILDDRDNMKMDWTIGYPIFSAIFRIVRHRSSATNWSIFSISTEVLDADGLPQVTQSIIEWSCTMDKMPFDYLMDFNERLLQHKMEFDEHSFIIFGERMDSDEVCHGDAAE